MAIIIHSPGRTRERIHRIRLRTRVSAPSFLDAELEFFSGLSPAALKRLSELLTIVDVPAGRSLGREGTSVREFIVVLRGSVAVSLRGHPLSVLDDGHHFGALPLLDPVRSPLRRASFHALTDTTIAVANRREFAAIRRDVPQVDRRVCELAERRQAYFDGVEDSRRHLAEEAGEVRFVGADFPVRVEAPH